MPSALRISTRPGRPLAQWIAALAMLAANVSAAPLVAADGRHGCAVRGTVQLGGIPQRGANVSATDDRYGREYDALTDGKGMYLLRLPCGRKFSVHAEFEALASASKDVKLAAGDERQVELVLDVKLAARGTRDLTSLWPSPLLPPVSTTITTLMQPAMSITGGNGGGALPTFTGDPGFSGDTFVVSGQATIAIPHFEMADQMRQYFEDGHQLQERSVQEAQLFLDAGVPITSGPVSSGAGTGVPQAGLAPPHGVVFWNGGNSVLNAEPYLLAGQPSPDPSYNSNSYGLAAGLHPYIPGLTRPGKRDFVFVSYAGQLSTSLVNEYGVVPTMLERTGNFSELVGANGQLLPIYPPERQGSTTPYPNNTINTPLDPAAVNLLKYIPEPNLQNIGLNYRLLTTQGTHSNTLGASYTHNFGAVPILSNSRELQQSVNVNFNLGNVNTDVINLFPGLGGKQRVEGYSVTAGYTIGKGNMVSTASVTSSRNDSEVRNPYTNGQDVATSLGLYANYPNVPINTNPLNFGLPNLIFNNFSGMGETQPNFQLTQTTSFSEASAWTHGLHYVRFGGDFHRVEFNIFGGVNATGSYIFTGGYTEIAGADNTNPVPTSGSSFADFLLGYPQETKLEAPYQKAYARQGDWDFFARDDWRILPKLTILAGIRYDYFSPFIEKDNRLSTLDYNSTFTLVAAVLPNGIGPISGAKYPRSLINPDRNNFSPHFGVAWQPYRQTAVRAAYGINYTEAQYGSFIQLLAYQTPFANVQANGNVPHFATPYPLQYGFGSNDDPGNYAVNRNYRLPYQQVWYVEVERALPGDILLNVGYSGAKGTRLDIISAPGFINSLPFPNALFDLEDSSAYSNYNALVVRATKRLQNGLALQATYSYSHSIDNASSINASSPIVIQNWQDPRAEESNSSFDIRHQILGSFLYELPVGPGKVHWNSGNWMSRAFGDWSVSGFFALATGMPLTPYITASVNEVARGTHGSVRPNRVPGVPIREGGGRVDHWFNTAAFSNNFAPGQMYGTASRYSIPGPGIENLNLSVSKFFAFEGARSVEIRGSANNAFNIVQYAGVNTQFDSSTVGQVNAVQPMRQITFLVRYRF